MPGPPCSVCESPDRPEIDRTLAADLSSNRAISCRYGLGRQSIQRHKSHLGEALVLAEREKVQARLDLRAFFDEQVQRLRMASDAYHEWHLDPADPTRYAISARAEEVDCLYDDWGELDEKGRPARKRATLQQLLDRLHDQPTPRDVRMLETKRADPRKMLVEVANSLAARFDQYLKAWSNAIEEDKLKLAQGLAAAGQDADGELRSLIEETLAATLEEDCRESLGDVVKPAVATKVASVQWRPLLERIIARFSHEEG